MPKAKNLKYFRTTHNLTQSQLADIMGVSRSTVIAWETRKRAIPMPSAKRIAEHFQIDYGDFCDIDLEQRDLGLTGSAPTQEEMNNLIKFRALPDDMKDAIRVAINHTYNKMISQDKSM